VPCVVQYSCLLGPFNSNVNEFGAAVLDNRHGNEFILQLFFLFFDSSVIFRFFLMEQQVFPG
jgi:hypothetical protein